MNRKLVSQETKTIEAIPNSEHKIESQHAHKSVLPNDTSSFQESTRFSIGLKLTIYLNY